MRRLGGVIAVEEILGRAALVLLGLLLGCGRAGRLTALRRALRRRGIVGTHRGGKFRSTAARMAIASKGVLRMVSPVLSDEFRGL